MLDTTNIHASLGHNNPPGPIHQAQDAMAELSAFLAEHPVIQSKDDADHGAAYIERTRIALGDARTERDTRTRPLNEQLKLIRAEYEIVREKSANNRGGALEAAYNELRKRLTAYADAVEAARIAELRKLEAEREEAERLAREKEAAEQAAIAGAEVGELTDVGGAIAEADSAFKDYRKADKAAAIASRNVPVRFNSVMGNKRLSMRTRRLLVVASIDDAARALMAIGLTDKIRTAILQSAKDFEDAYGELPEGVSESFERSL